MARTIKLTLVGCLALLGLAGPADAAGPVDGSVGILWWDSEFDSGATADAAAPGFRGELWVHNKLGVRANMFRSDLGDLGQEDADYLSADVMWKVLNPTEKSFIAAGLGWSDMEFTESGIAPMNVETSGLRASIEGRVGVLAMLDVYGLYSYLPDMDDSSPAVSDVYRDLKGQEYEAGVDWKVAPMIDLRFAYRSTELDFTHEPAPALGTAYDGEMDSSGFMFGAGVHF
jgi:hypothetical protein